MKPLSLLTVCFLVLASTNAFAIRCNSKVVGKGDTQYQFLKVCGEPDFVRKKTVYITDSVVSHGKARGGYHSHDKEIKRPQVVTYDVGTVVSRGQNSAEVEYRHERERAIEIEYWIYDFGPNRLVQEVKFVDGVARAINNQGYGSSR